MNQQDAPRENPAPLLDSIRMLQCIGSKPSTALPQRSIPARLSAIVDRLTTDYGRVALLHRFNADLNNSSISSEHQLTVRLHAYEYGGSVTSLCEQFWEAGTVMLYIDSNSRRQESGEWGAAYQSQEQC